MRLGLLLGGGGAVGIAWENAVIAGLMDATDLDPSAATVIVGTSAGAAVGADMALGKDPHHILDTDATSPRRAIGTPDLEKGPFAEIIGLMMSADATDPATIAEIGRLALTAEPVMPIEDFLAMFATTVGTDEWPDVDFRPTTCECSTGNPKEWTAADGIELSRAVASSCAIPGYFPPVPFDGDHYIDGSRGRDYHTRIVADLDLDAALFIGPNLPVPGVGEMLRKDMEALAATGVTVHTILGSERLDAEVGLNLMEFSLRPLAFEIGLADGAAHAPAVARLLAT